VASKGLSADLVLKGQRLYVPMTIEKQSGPRLRKITKTSYRFVYWRN
jgi:hypothetical protein